MTNAFLTQNDQSYILFERKFLHSYLVCAINIFWAIRQGHLLYLEA